MSFTQVTVVGTISDSTGFGTSNATIQFSLTAPITDEQSGVITLATPIIATTDSNGQFSIILNATDDTFTTPRGQVYRIEIQIPSDSPNGVYTSGTYYPVYYAALPASAAPRVNLAQLIGGDPIPTYVGPTGPTGPAVAFSPQTITGSRATEVVLTNLLSGLAAEGIIIDSTTP